MFHLFIQVYIENDYKELNVCIQYPPTHNTAVLSKKVAPKDNTPMSNVRQHRACGTPSGTYTITKLKEKKLTGGQQSHKVHAGTGRNNLSSPKCRRNMFVHQMD
jgi:hypothetical protein